MEEQDYGSTGATICLVAAALPCHRHSPIVIPFMLTALHTAWVVTKYERGGYKPALLLNIVNPMAWLTRVEFDVNAVRLMDRSAGQQQRRSLKPTSTGGRPLCAIPEGQHLRQHGDRPQCVGAGRRADRLRADALVLYPGEPLLTGSAASRSLRPGAQTLLMSGPGTAVSLSITAASRPANHSIPGKLTVGIGPSFRTWFLLFSGVTAIGRS